MLIDIVINRIDDRSTLVVDTIKKINNHFDSIGIARLPVSFHEGKKTQLILGKKHVFYKNIIAALKVPVLNHIRYIKLYVKIKI